MLHIVLVEPEIPMNTGNIARTCAATGSVLHLIEPLGFDISDKAVRRAGLDYWHLVDVRTYRNVDDFFARNQVGQMFLLSTKAPRSYTEAHFDADCFLFFGKETRGLPEDFLRAHPDQCLRIPIRTEARSLNLANAVAVVAFEALRQQDFPHLSRQGAMKDWHGSHRTPSIWRLYAMNYNKKSVEDVAVEGRKVLLRCDFNVPLKAGVITSDKRIVAALPTIQYLLAHGAAVIACSHLGKPKGEDPALSLSVVAKRLSELLGKEVIMAKDVAGPDAKAKAAALRPGEIMLLENTRFAKGETKNDPELSKDLASMADLFCNDAFGSAHRAHSSTAGVADYLPAFCGFLIQKEIGIMGKALSDPARPFVAILGGAKVSDKLNVINNLLEKVDTLIIGGGMAYTFLAAQGHQVGASLLDSEKLDYCRDMLKKAGERGVRLLLPVDTVVAASFPDPIDGPVETRTVDAVQIPADMMGLDIGEKTRECFAAAIRDAKTVVWNGPMGVFENPTLAKGTIAVAQALADSSATTIVGGGDSAAACEQLGFADQITHISTGGGASLEFLEGLELPGIACLEDR